LPTRTQGTPNPLLHFCEEMSQNLRNFASAWKPNVAFFERWGSKGYQQLEEWIAFEQNQKDKIPIILDAKRGDLGNTAKEYAYYYFRTLQVDALTIHPYMGFDTVVPYWEVGGFVFLLCLTSNPSSQDFQHLSVQGEPLYLAVLDRILQWEEQFPGQVGIVLGGTHPNEIQDVQKRAPNLPILVPGFGSQGASLADVLPVAGDFAILNASRSLTLLSKEDDYLEKAMQATKEMHQQIQMLRKKNR